MTINSICLPVSVHPDAPYIIYDADGNRVAECGDAFLHLWPGDSGIQKLHDAETMASELVTVINAHEDLIEALESWGLWVREFNNGGGVFAPLPHLIAHTQRALAAARVEVPS